MSALGFPVYQCVTGIAVLASVSVHTVWNISASSEVMIHSFLCQFANRIFLMHSIHGQLVSDQ